MNINSLKQSCQDILIQNMGYIDQSVYLLYDTESPLATILSDAWISVLLQCNNAVMREFKNPPQPLYRGGLINPDNPHLKEQNRIITAHNIEENNRIGLDHHIVKSTGTDSNMETYVDSQIDILKNELTSLPPGSIVILVQSTNFRLSTFRIRLELFNLGIHVVEFNHLAYILDTEFDTFIDSLVYRTPEYLRIENIFEGLMKKAISTRIKSVNGTFLNFGPVEKIRGNTGDYDNVENKGGTFPIGEIFTEAIDLSSVHGKCLIESYPREDFSVEHCDPFQITVENGRVLPNDNFPAPFAKLYNWIVQFEGEVMVRELGMGLNPAITKKTSLSDINFYERKTGIHLSLGKKHGIYGKKLPKTEIQRFHIDVFIAVDSVFIDEKQVFQDRNWII